MNITCTIDLESYSEADLKVVGLDNYASHPSTEFLGFAFSINDADPLYWFKGEPFPRKLADFLARYAEHTTFAHNAPFERVMWEKVGVEKHGFPALPAHRWECTAARAAYHNLPRALDKAPVTLGIAEALHKDKDGHAIMLKVCCPGKPYVPPELACLPTGMELLETLIRNVQRGDKKLRADVVEEAKNIAAGYVTSAGIELDRLTNGTVTKVSQKKKIQTWLNGCGIEIADMKAAAVAQWLEEQGGNDVESAVLSLYQNCNSAAMKRYLAQLKPFPPAPVEPKDDPEMLDRVAEYCIQDVRAEVALHQAMPPVPEWLHELELVVHKINCRGMPVDMPMVDGARKIVDIAAHLGGEELLELTDGAVEKATQHARIQTFLAERGVRLVNMQAETVAEALEQLPPGPARRVLQLRSDLASAAVKKYNAFTNQVSSDGFVRHQYKFYGASQTGRLSGAGVQPQNLKRIDKGFKLDTELYDAIVRGDHDYVAERGNVFDVLANSLRSAIYAGPGRLFVEADWSGIENRVLHWLADDFDTLKLIRDGADLYLEFAPEICDKSREELDKNSPERQIAKAAVLGLGFCQGWAGFQRYVKKTTGTELPDEECQNVVSAYRSRFEPVTAFWRRVQQAAVACVRTGREINGGRWKFCMDGDWLCMVLPCGRHLRAFRPETEMGEYGLEITYQSPRGRREWSTPVLIENMVQATAASLLFRALLAADREYLNVVGTTHDSLYLVIDEHDDESIPLLESIMLDAPEWAEGLPLGVEIDTSERMH